MISENFQHENIIGTVRRVHPRRAEFDKALITRALTRAYSISPEDYRSAMAFYSALDVQPPNGETTPTPNPDAIISNAGGLESMNIIGMIAVFADLFVHIEKLNGLPYTWPVAYADGSLIVQAFQSYLDDEPAGLFDLISEIAKRLDNPNGNAGGLADALTADQSANPLSSSPA